MSSPLRTTSPEQTTELNNVQEQVGEDDVYEVNIPKLRADMEFVTQNLHKVINLKQERLRN